MNDAERQFQACWQQVGEYLSRSWKLLPGDSLVVGSSVRSSRPSREIDALVQTLMAERDPQTFFKTLIESAPSFALNTSHPQYFGVFNPRPDPYAVVADALASGWNWQLASQTSAPLAIAMETAALSWLADALGFPMKEGTFTAGGSEANATAVWSALAKKAPEWQEQGVSGRKFAVILSDETHHSVHRAVRLAGLGGQSIFVAQSGDDGLATAAQFQHAVQSAQASGREILLVVASAGTTNAGMIEPLDAISEIARQCGAWYHVDGAWGAVGAMVPEWSEGFNGLAKADSLTLDAHKWLNVPFTAGVFLSRHAGVQALAFQMEGTPYMPSSTGHTFQPYQQSFAWSRGFRGLKVFALCALLGRDGIKERLLVQAERAEQLRMLLLCERWRVLNRTQLPVVCFTSGSSTEDEDATWYDRVAAELVDEGNCWITTTDYRGKRCLRAGIANYETTPESIEILVAALNLVRRRLSV